MITRISKTVYLIFRTFGTRFYHSQNKFLNKVMVLSVRHVTGNDQDYLRKIPRAVVQISALL